MIYREQNRLARQLNLDPNMWVMVAETTSYILFKHALTGELTKRYYGGECR